jgi:hypothetical protein
MPIIPPNQTKNLEKIRIQVPSVLLEEIRSYCKEFLISEPEDFFNGAAKHVLKIDRDWQKISKKM